MQASKFLGAELGLVDKCSAIKSVSIDDEASNDNDLYASSNIRKSLLMIPSYHSPKPKSHNFRACAEP